MPNGERSELASGLGEDLHALIEDAPREDLPALAGALAAASAEILVRLTAPGTTAPAAEDSNVSVREAARRLGMSDRYIYKHADRLPFVRRIGRRVVCSARAVAEWSDRQRR